MNKLFKTILIGLMVLLGAGVFAVPQTSANGNLVVQFEQTPLFNEANFIPGDAVTRWAKVINNTGSLMPIATTATNVSDPDNLGSQLNLVIKEGATVLYYNTLANFFTAGEVFLSNLAGGGSQTQYDFSITFDPSDGNPYQGKSLVFNIQIGFQGDLPSPTPTPTTSPTFGTTGTTGGGAGGSSETLIIYNEVASGVENTSATITWKTKVSLTDFPYPASSQVIYSAAGEPHSLDLNDNTGSPPKYGYAHTTPETDISPKVVDHSVTINGLTPGTTYYFRCVSRGSLAVSTELTLTTSGVAGETTEEGETTGGGATPTPTPEEGLGQEETGGGQVAGAESGTGMTGFLATIANAFNMANFCWLLFFLIIILLILYLLSIIKPEGAEKKKSWILPLITFILIVVYCIFCCSECGGIFCCKICWILLIILAVLYLLSLFLKGKKV